MINPTTNRKRNLFALALCFLGTLVFASHTEGQGGSGGGGMGGGMGAIPEGDTYTSTNILSPGDASDWPFEVRDGETLIISVKSDVFDPMVEIVDTKKRVVAENDDVRRGVQDSLLLHYFPKGGKYKALVKAAKQGAGGAYQFSVRRFVASEARVGSRTVGTLGKPQIQWHRFSAEVGQTVVLTTTVDARVNLDVIAPNGEDIKELRYLSSSRPVFRATSSGTHYVRLSGLANLRYALTIALARVFPLTPEKQPTPTKLEIGGLDLWKFQGKAGELVTLQAKTIGRNVSISLEYLPPSRKEDEAVLPDTLASPIIRLPMNTKEPSLVVALLNKTGTYQVATSQQYGQETTYSLSLSTAIKTIPPNGDSSGKLAIGGSDYWVLEGKAGEVVRLNGVSEQFDAMLTLYSPEGEMLGTNDDGGEGTNAQLTVSLQQTGHYLLRMHSAGGGGSGTYQIQTVRNPVKVLTFDKIERGQIGSESSEIWSFQARAGQTVIISVRSSDFDVSISLRGPDGVEIGSDDDGGDGTNSLLSRRLPLNGTYTLWINTKQGRGKYVLRLIEAP